MNELTAINHQNIQDTIYTIRGLQVMLDKDLAELYAVKPTRLREQVRRNTKKFPIDFMFELTENEVDSMVSQNAIPSKQHLGGSLPLVFTEQGVSMLATVLRSDVAIEISIKIMRAFVNMRKFDLSHDRFLIIDETEVYHFGASLKDLGKKWFAVSKMDVNSLEIIKKLGVRT